MPLNDVIKKIIIAGYDTSGLYLVDKDKHLNTEVYSVDEFNIRNDKNKLYEDYLKGKLGGING